MSELTYESEENCTIDAAPFGGTVSPAILEARIGELESQLKIAADRSNQLRVERDTAILQRDAAILRLREIDRQSEGLSDRLDEILKFAAEDKYFNQVFRENHT